MALVRRGASANRTALARFFSTSGTSNVDQEQSGKHVPFGELGSGYYSDATKGCFDVIAKAQPMMIEACAAVLEARKARDAAGKGEAFSIADYGCADGGTSLPLMTTLVEMVRKAEPNTPIVLLMEDQASNDWTSVFRRLQGELQTESSLEGGEGNKLGGILDKYPQVTALACGVSFYQACFPRESVDLMFSATAMHWLRNTPVRMAQVLHSAMLNPDTAEHASFIETADTDFRSILSSRAKELKPGGRFGCVSFAKNDDGYFLGKSSHVAESMHGQFRDIWQGFVDEGIITQEEFQDTNFPNQYRSLEEYLSPFGGCGGDAKATDAEVLLGGTKGSKNFEGLHLISANYGEVRCPYHLRWVREGSGDAAKARVHAENYVPTTRTWSNSTFEAGLSRSRSQGERAEIVEAMFQRYTDAVAADPVNHAMDYWHAYMMIEKPCK